MRRGLVGDDVDRRIAASSSRHHLGGVAEQPDRQRALGVPGLDGQPQSVVDDRRPWCRGSACSMRRSMRVSVAVHADRHTVVHGDGQRLRAAHAAEAGGQGDGAGQACRRTSCLRRPRRRSRRCPAGCPGCRCRSTSRRSSGRTSSGPAASSSRNCLPIRPVANQIRVRDQHAGRPLVGAEHADRLAGLHQHGLVVLQAAQRAQRSRRTPPSCGRHGRCRRRPPVPRGARRPRGRGCSSACAARPPAASPCS